MNDDELDRLAEAPLVDVPAETRERLRRRVHRMLKTPRSPHPSFLGRCEMAFLWVTLLGYVGWLVHALHVCLVGY